MATVKVRSHNTRPRNEDTGSFFFVFVRYLRCKMKMKSFKDRLCARPWADDGSRSVVFCRRQQENQQGQMPLRGDESAVASPENSQ